MRDGHLSRKKEEKLGPTAGQCSPQPAPVSQVPALWEGFNTFSVANELVSGEKITRMLAQVLGQEALGLQSRERG